MEQDSEVQVKLNFEGLICILQSLECIANRPLNLDAAIRLYLDLKFLTSIEMDYKLSELSEIYNKIRNKFEPYFTSDSKEMIKALININK